MDTTTARTEIEMKIEIRPLHTRDGEAWRRLWTAYLEFYGSEVSEEIYATTLSRLLDSSRPQQNALVAANGDELVGLAHYIFHPHNWRLEEVCYLQDLYVDPDHRGRGVGRALIEGIYTAADKYGSPYVYWLTQDFNETARKLYDRVATLTSFIKYQR